MATLRNRYQLKIIDILCKHLLVSCRLSVSIAWNCFVHEIQMQNHTLSDKTRKTQHFRFVGSMYFFHAYLRMFYWMSSCTRLNMVSIKWKLRSILFISKSYETDRFGEDFSFTNLNEIQLILVIWLSIRFDPINQSFHSETKYKVKNILFFHSPNLFNFITTIPWNLWFIILRLLIRITSMIWKFFFI